MTHVTSDYAHTARAVAGLVARIGQDAWDGPSLGEWTLRDLVGHTSRSLVTVIDYLRRPVEEEAVDSAAGYFVAIAGILGSPDQAAAVTERGRQAGRDLGSDPDARFAELAEEAVGAATMADPDLVVHTIAGGMRVEAYLPTRTFELCVHGLDIAAATELSLDLPEGALARSAMLAAQVAAARGRGADVLLALTGRRGLPDGFSVV
ncbi:MAG: maleylpyruvate isomerase N-terminal domain-containing protein [Nocardioides sp.]